ncbi:MAG: helix-turn-helix domain-containing protein, partial [Candidatus Eremiobacteraeota bacterium]|nr:helix-turn-helix domain-containing protein [Candidatus Eremiobacteraeota bacterium]
MEDERLRRLSPFGDLLRQHRVKAGLSQEALAERARMSARGIGALERGDRRTPQRETLLLLAEALSLDGTERRAFEEAADPVGSRRPRGATDGVTEISRPSNLPTPLTTFIGREDDVATICELVRHHRLVTIVGPGGIGKTRTALESAHRCADVAGDGAILVDLSALSNGERVTSAIASAIGVPQSAGRSAEEMLLGYLAHKRSLIILDNCEHVITEVRRITRALLQGCAGLRILATSRESLNVEGERCYSLASIAIGEAVRLFGDRATAANRAFAIDDGNRRDVEEICRRLDGIPLALELAATR